MYVVGCSRAGTNWKPNSAGFQRRRRNLPQTPNSAAPIRPTTRRSAPISTKPPQYTPLRRHSEEISPKHHHHHHLNSLIQKLTNEPSPLKVLEEDGDWSKDQFWAAIEFLKQNSRFEEIQQVFDAWTSLDKARVSELNYKKLIGLLCEMGLVEEAILGLEEMKSHGFGVSLEVYNSIVHGYANKGQFEEALIYLNGMQDDAGLKPNDETYDGLIAAYGKFSKFDEMVKCFDMMKSNGFSPDHVTYNLMIREFSKGGLLSRMEKTHQALLSKNMGLQTSTLTAMIEAYVNFGMVDKMEAMYRKAIKWKSLMREELIRKIAKVYIENYMFSRLDRLGEDLSIRKGRTRLYWCLKLLYHACLLSKKGMSSVLEEMEEARVPWDATVGNILLLAHLKMKDFKSFKSIHSQLPGRCVIPDIVTFGILFDANQNGFDWSRALESWKIHGFLDRFVEMNTDPLVPVAFGKGQFLTMLEETYPTLEPQARKEKRWTYQSLLEFVLEHNPSRLQPTTEEQD